MKQSVIRNHNIFFPAKKNKKKRPGSVNAHTIGVDCPGRLSSKGVIINSFYSLNIENVPTSGNSGPPWPLGPSCQVPVTLPMI